MKGSPLTTHTRHIVATLVSCLLTSATAEGTWVLWRHSTYPPTERSNWSVIATYPHEAACMDGGERKREADLGRAYVLVIKGARESRSYTCLPETMDPRGTE